MNWLMLPLEQMAEIIGGSTPSRTKSEFWGGDIPWLTPTDLPMPGQGIAQVTETTDYITSLGLSSCSANLLPIGTILFSSRATIGKLGIAKVLLATNQGFTNFIPKSFLYNFYLAYALQYFTSEITLLAGSTTFKEVSKGSLKKFKIPLPTLSEQRCIVEILDQADALRRMRTEADAKADRILPALFIKMFGDPATNPMGWDVNTLGNLLIDIESGWSPKCESREAAAEEWGVLKLSSVTYGSFKPTENKALLHGDSPRPNLEVKRGDLLFTRKNTHDLVGASAFVYNTRPRLMLPDLIFRLCLSNEVDPVYVWQLLSQKAMRYQLSKLAGGTAGSMPNISKARLRTLSIPVPTLKLQLKYREISNKFWETQQNQKTSTQIIDSLFQTLLQRAFTGELTAKWREAHMKELLAEMEEQAKALNLKDNKDSQQLSLL